MLDTKRDRYFLLRDESGTSPLHPLGGRLLGDWRGFVYTCPACGGQWGRVLLGSKGTFFNITWPCSEHSTPRQCGGVFLPALEWFDPFFPKNYTSLSYEFLLSEALARVHWLLNPPTGARNDPST